MKQIRRILCSTLLAMALCATGCSDDAPSDAGTVPGCESNRTPPSANGFVVTAPGYDSVAIVLDSAIFNATAFVQFGTQFAVSIESTVETAGGDTVDVELLLEFPGTVGTHTWGQGITKTKVVLKQDNLTQTFSGGTGRTTVTTVTEDPDSVRGTFCGTLKDSLNRSATIVAGSFKHD